MFLSFFWGQSARAEESTPGLADLLWRALPNAGRQQRPELRKDQPQPLEPALPQAAAQPHALRIQGEEALQYPALLCALTLCLSLRGRYGSGWLSEKKAFHGQKIWSSRLKPSRSNVRSLRKALFCHHDNDWKEALYMTAFKIRREPCEGAILMQIHFTTLK